MTYTVRRRCLFDWAVVADFKYCGRGAQAVADAMNRIEAERASIEDGERKYEEWCRGCMAAPLEVRSDTAANGMALVSVGPLKTDCPVCHGEGELYREPIKGPGVDCCGSGCSGGWHRCPACQPMVEVSHV